MAKAVQRNGGTVPASEPIRVFVRLRPAEDNPSCVQAQSSRQVVLLPPTPLEQTAGLPSAREYRSQAKLFEFDRVFAAHATQSDVYAAVSHLVQDVVDGFSCTVFAYGCTGSGKTHTMFGSAGSPGIIPRLVRDLFAQLTAYSRSHDAASMVYLSYVELYNNYFFDLLSEHPDLTCDRVTLRDSNTFRGVYLTGSPSIRKPVSSAEEVLELIRRGDRYRATNATALNDRSSRSHAIITLEVEVQQGAEESSSSSEPQDANVQIGKINLVDLAGSERVALSQATGQTLTEAQNINLALTVLGDVLSALSKQHKSGVPPNKQFVPYRNSKLTHLLKDSLGGNSRTIMITTLRQGLQFYQQSQICLRYAARARHIQNTPVHNTDSIADQATIRANLSEIARLKQQLLQRSKEFDELKRSAALGTAQAGEMHQRLDELQRRNQQEKEELEKHLRCIIHGQEGRLAAQENAYNHLQGQLEVYELAVRKQKQKIKHLRQTQQETQARQQEMSVENERLSQDLQELRADNALLDQRNAELRQELEKLAGQKYDHWDQERAKYRSAMALLAKERDQYRKECQQMQQALQATADRDQQTRQKLAQLIHTAASTGVESQHQRLAAQVSRLDADSNRLVALRQKMVAAAGLHRTTAKELRAENQSLATRLAELETQVALNRADKEVVHLEKSRLQEEAVRDIKKLQDAVSQLEGKVHRRERCLAKQSEQHSQQAASIMTTANNFSARMSASLEQLQANVEERMQVMNSTVEKLKQRAALLSRAIVSHNVLQTKLEATKIELQAKSEQNVALQRELQEMTRKADARRKDLVTVSNKVVKLQKAESRAKQKVVQLEALPASIDELVLTKHARVEDLHQQLEELQQRRFLELDEWNSKELELTTRVEQLADANTALERAVGSKEREIAALRKALESEQQSNTALREALMKKSKQFAVKEEQIREDMSQSFKQAVEQVRQYFNHNGSAELSMDMLNVDFGEDIELSFTSEASSEHG